MIINHRPLSSSLPLPAVILYDFQSFNVDCADNNGNDKARWI